MVSALDMEKLKYSLSNKYENGEKRIVGIMIARYDLPLTQKLIDSCYSYWHYNTGRTLDLFWIGYGEYLCPDDETNNKIILKFDGNKTRVYFDRRKFISEKDSIYKIIKRRYNDRLELILVNYYDNYLHFDEFIKIDLEKGLDSNFTYIRELMEFITNKCGEFYDVYDLRKSLLSKWAKDRIKGNLENISIKDLIGILKI